MQPHPAPITDIWFRSPLTLNALAAALGLQEPSSDAEDYWAWVIGWLDGVRLDVTRTHTAPAGLVDTRIFCCDIGPFTAELKKVVVEKLLKIDCGPISCGRWVYRSGNDYDLQVVERFTRSG